MADKVLIALQDLIPLHIRNGLLHIQLIQVAVLSDIGKGFLFIKLQRYISFLLFYIKHNIHRHTPFFS